ncbi:MAG: hypothetical protein M1136_02455 [Chloroflexi bacterium]|nr:hypothetical protein [Chloroflexota bacterium]
MNERGQSIIELLMMMAISSLLAVFITSFVLLTYRTFSDTTRSASNIKDISLAGTWLAEDITAAQSGNAPQISLSPTPVGNTLTLAWNDLSPSPTVTHTVQYSLSGNQLLRTHSTSSGPQTTIIIARNLAGPNDLTFQLSGDTYNPLVTVNITVTSDSEVLTSTLKVASRSRYQ